MCNLAILARLACLVGLQLAYVVVATATAAAAAAEALSKCPGYEASNIQSTKDGLTADLHLAGRSCDAYGKDLDNLRLQVSAETRELFPCQNQSELDPRCSR